MHCEYKHDDILLGSGDGETNLSIETVESVLY